MFMMNTSFSLRRLSLWSIWSLSSLFSCFSRSIACLKISKGNFNSLSSREGSETKDKIEEGTSFEALAGLFGFSGIFGFFQAFGDDYEPFGEALVVRLHVVEERFVELSGRGSAGMGA